jgi:hypothetical protein
MKKIINGDNAAAEAAAGHMKCQRGGSGSGEMAKTENETNQWRKSWQAKRKQNNESAGEKAAA